MKINKERIKQILLTVIALSLILVGYLNYNFDKKVNETVEVSTDASSRNELNLGDVQLVNSEPENAIVPNDELEENSSDKVEIEDNYFEESRIQRDRMYSEMLSTYQKLVNSNETPADQKAIAVQEISKITSMKNGIMIAENLIKNKGFENVVIMENYGMVSVVVKTPTLNQEQISKIQNIVERELKVEVQNINISNK